jgi:hypothetical protein
MEAKMTNSRTISLFAAAALALGAGAASAASPLRVAGFGPPVSGDTSLNVSIGVLMQTIAWRHAPESDVFQLALAAAAAAEPFENVALASDPMHGASFAPAVHNGPTLNANEAVLTQWIAYRNSPEGDAFHADEPDAAIASTTFLRVALASVPKGSLDLRDE